MMKIPIAVFLLIAVCVVYSQKSLEFKIEYYWGLRQDGVVKLMYTSRKSDWPRQPYFCYGVLINWREAIVPCSCVAYNTDNLMTSPWNQATPSTAVRAIQPSDIKIGLMSNEHSSKEQGSATSVLTIKLHPKCDATFQVDYALVILRSKLEKSRLVWVNSPHKDELSKQIDRVTIGSAIGGNCLILRWSESIPEPGAPHKWEVLQSSVKFQHWDMCLPLVCPQFKKDGTTPYSPKYPNDCAAKTQGNRLCLTWVQEISLCNLVPGTPVFCDVGDIRGVMGLVSNFTTDCPFSNYFNGVMGAFDDAMDIAAEHLRVQNSEYFSQLRFE